MAFILPKLNYNYDALEPYIDAKTMEIHHTKHHASYLKKFNEAIKDTELENQTPTEIFAKVSEYSEAVKNNGGGFFNHALYWKILTPNQTGQIDNNLKDAIIKYFGTIENLKDEFSKAAATQFGSGWAWLVKKDNNELIVTSTPNQINPLMNIAPIQGKPILCIDVWEHAYYLKYQNRRPDFVEAFWDIINWDTVSKRFEEI